jgi:hypothetical protein
VSFFCQAHRKIAFCRRPKLKLTANSAVTAKKNFAETGSRQTIIFLSAFVADGNMLFCREHLTARMYFAVSFFWQTGKLSLS